MSRQQVLAAWLGFVKAGASHVGLVTNRRCLASHMLHHSIPNSLLRVAKTRSGEWLHGRGRPAGLKDSMKKTSSSAWKPR
ncbi:hypothetical protein PGT21_016275 [Puccinia graminis f. sp. tritici]|uniref:Uncharacterized protein n=1 Tax=Puccinia graminis f. sp. tritici TaxID=56615 RepID=A0A5B0N4G0_PUCGR|nr:hypothetical protein PGT21_016275 [Puccinia graminis f. sp. tritici]